MTGTHKHCTACGHAASETARFCERCGEPLRGSKAPLRAPGALARKIRTERREIEGERKQVTVMFTDIVGSMSLTRALNTERWGAILDRFLGIASRTIHGLEGTVNQFTGDGLMAVFGAPVAHEDHARRACLAALRLGQEVAALAEELDRSDGVQFSIRCGLNSGEVIVGSIGDDLHMDFAPLGNTTALGKRMESLAPAGSTAISASTAALIEREFELRELGDFEVKGAVERQRVFELVGPGAARSRLDAAAQGRGLPRFVGRATERERLELALKRALAGEGAVIAICGEPGVGKSRLSRVFVSDCRERGLAVNTVNVVAHGRAVPLLPVSLMLREYFGIGDRTESSEARKAIQLTLSQLDASFEAELPLIFEFLGVPDPERRIERIDPEARERRLLAFVTRLVRAESRRDAVVLLIEDLHWIDDASASFLEQLVEAADGERILLITTFRPEYSAAWLKNPGEQLMTLAPLDPGEAGELLRVLLGSDPSLDGLAEAIHERTGGNPFFIEEMVQALAEVGHLTGDRGRYRLMNPLEELVLPPTVQAVLSARIDRLGARDKALVQAMSVIGRKAREPILRQVVELTDAELDEALNALEAAEFLAAPTSNGDREFSFKHPLTQEVAYASQLSTARARAHAGVAEAIERVYPEGLEEHALILAHHYLQAVELTPATATGADDLRRRALRASIRAGERATVLGALDVTARQFAAALELLPEGDPRRAPLLLRQGRALVFGKIAGEEVLIAATEAADAIGDRLTAAGADSLLGTLYGEGGRGELARSHTARALKRAEGLPASPGKAEILAEVSRVFMWTSESERSLRAGTEALVLAEQFGLEALQARVLLTLGCARDELGDHERAIADLERGIEIAERLHSLEAIRGYSNLHITLAYGGDLARAADALAAGQRYAEGFGVGFFSRGLRFAELEQLNMTGSDWDRALELADELADEESFEIVTCFELGARIQLARGDVDGATETARRNLEFARLATAPMVLIPALAMYALVALSGRRDSEADAAVDELLPLLRANRHTAPPNVTRPLSVVLERMGRGAELRRFGDSMAARWPWWRAAYAYVDRDFGRAAQIYTTIGARFDEAYARLRLADRLVAEGRHADAAASLQATLPFFRSVDATAYVRQAERLYAVCEERVTG
jgi:class 3 adenylate cyclase/tetratricopeptide (TPR) repeat protein